MFCASYSLQRFTETGDQLKPLPCKSWNCKECRYKRKRQLIAQAIAGKPNKMLTLTITTNIGTSPNHRRKMLHEAWTKLRKRMARKLKVKDIPYMAFVEKTEQGEPHLHILLRCKYIHYKWYRKQMKELVKSPVIWIEKIKGPDRAAFYVTKYCTKAPAQFLKMKRYWRSQNYDQRPVEDQKKDFCRTKYDRLLRERYSEIVEYRLSRHWALKTIGDGWIDFMEPRKMQVKPGYVFRRPGDTRLYITRGNSLEHVGDFASLSKGVSCE